jgi:hypothetical protein
MVMLLVVVLIVGLLASRSLKQYFGVDAGKQAPAGAAYSAAPPAAPATAIERARSVGDIVQKGAEQQREQIDEAASK